LAIEFNPLNKGMRNMSIKPPNKVANRFEQQPLTQNQLAFSRPDFLSEYVKISEKLDRLDGLGRKIEKCKIKINEEVDTELNLSITKIFEEVKLFEKNHCPEASSEDAKTKERLIKKSKKSIMKIHNIRMKVFFTCMWEISRNLAVKTDPVPDQVCPDFPKRIQKECRDFIKASVIFDKCKSNASALKSSILRDDINAKERFEVYKENEGSLKQHGKSVAEALQLLEKQKSAKILPPDGDKTEFKQDGSIKFSVADPFAFLLKKEGVNDLIRQGKEAAIKIKSIAFVYLIAQFDEMIPTAESGNFEDVKKIVETLPEQAQKDFFNTHWKTCGSPADQSKEQSQKDRAHPRFGRFSFLDLDITKKCVASNEEKIQSLKDHRLLLKTQLNDLKGVVVYSS
jgi:hypothetical protein